MPNCPNCNANIPEGAKFCAACGARVAITQYDVPATVQNPARLNMQ